MLGGALALLALALSLYAVLTKRECYKVGRAELGKSKERERRRYVLFQVLAENPERLEPECLERSLISLIEKNYGKIGLAIANPKVVYFDINTKNLIVRTNLEGKNIIASSTIEPVSACDTQVKLLPLRAFGTLKSAREKIPKVA